MQFKASTLALALAAVPAFSQSLGDLPQCAEAPAIAAIGSTGCQLTDFSCICKDQSFLQSLEPQIQAACSPSDLQKALQFAQSTCASAGVSLSLPAVTGSATAASSAAASSGSVTAAATTTVTAAANGTSGLSLGPGPIATASSNISSAASFVSSAISAATSLAASIASSNATVATATRTGSSSGSGSSGGATAASGSSGSSTASASASAGAAAANFVQGGVGLIAGALGALLAL